MAKLRTIGLFLFSVQAVAFAQPADLLTVITEAERSDPAFYTALNSGRSTEVDVALARANLLPTVTGGYSWSRFRSHQILLGSKARGYDQSWTARATQSLINIQDWQNYFASKAEAESARMTINYAYQTLLDSVSLAYFAQASAQEAVLLQEEQVALNQRLLQLTKKRYQAGQCLLSDMLMAKTALISSRTQLFVYKQSLATAVGNLSLHLPRLVKVVAPIKGHFSPAWSTSYDLRSWERLAIKKNPNVQAMRYNMIQAKKTVDAARAVYVPTLSTALSYRSGNSKTTTTGPFSTVRTKTTSGSLELDLAIPIYQGGAMFSQIKQNLYLFYAARDNWQLSKRQVVTSLYASFQSMKEDVRSIKLQRRSMLVYQKNLVVTKTEYKLGDGTLIDVQNAVSEYYFAKLSLLQAQYQFLTDYVNCKFQMGLLSLKDINAINQWMRPHG